MMNRKNTLSYSNLLWIALLSFTCSMTAAVQPESSMQEILSQFTKYAEITRNDWHVPGMAIAIVQDGETIYVRGFGERNEKKDPVTPNTIFDIASLTKSFTAVLLAMQLEQGKYDWNTKILKLYPNFKLYDPNVTKEFEVQDLLAHNSGLPEEVGSILGNFGYSIDHILQILRFVKPVAPFRTEWRKPMVKAGL